MRPSSAFSAVGRILLEWFWSSLKGRVVPNRCKVVLSDHLYAGMKPFYPEGSGLFPSQAARGCWWYTLTRVPETGTTNAKAGSTWWPSALHFFFILCPATSPPSSSPAPSLQFYLPSPLFPSLRPFLCPTLFLSLLPPYRTLFISSHIPSLHPSNCL